MSASQDLSGRWTGYYLQHGQQHSITADLVQEETRLGGVMYDGEPDAEYSLFELAQHIGLAPGADEKIAEQVRAAYPDAPKGSIRYVTRLPTDSVLTGRRKEQHIYFLKSYQGTTFSGYKVGDQLLGTELPGHSVHYEGRLSYEGVEIDGQWWIDANPEIGSLRCQGLFFLRRQQTGIRK